MPYLEHKHGKTYYTAKGRNKDHKKTLIFLHGGPGGMHEVKSPLFNLSNARKVVLYDQVGGGKSSPLNKNEMKIETFVNELEILITQLAIKDFHLAGQSWGTTLALEYYLRKKGRGVQSLIFQSPMFSAKIWENDSKKLISKMSKEDQKVIRYCHEIQATDSRVYKDVIFKYYLKHVLRSKKHLNEMINRKNKNGDEVYQHMWGPSEFKPTGTLKMYNRVPELSKINVPAFFVCGEYDEATPDATASFSNKVKNSRLKVVKAASHVILKEKPNEMLSEIRKFLDYSES